MSYEDFKKSVAELGNTVSDLKSVFNDKVNELKGIVPENLVDSLAAQDATVKQINDQVTKIQQRADDLEVAIKRKKLDDTMHEGLSDQEKKAIDAFFGAGGFMRKGEEKMSADAIEAIKALSTDSDPDGGFLVPAPVVSKITEVIYETSPIRQYANTETLSTAAEWKQLYDADEAEAFYVNEQQARPATGTPKLKEQKIPLHEIYANPGISQTMLDDSGYNVERWLQNKITNRFARKENNKFITGSGVDEPTGLLSYPDGDGSFGSIERVASGDATKLTGDSAVTLETALKAQYRAGAIYFMARATEGAIRLLKDGQDNFLWQPSYQLGTPRTLNGYAYAIFEDMPAIGAGALALGFGNLREGYTIVDKAGIRVLRDPYTNKPYVHYYTTKRSGGDVTNFEAIKLCEVGT